MQCKPTAYFAACEEVGLWLEFGDCIRLRSVLQHRLCSRSVIVLLKWVTGSRPRTFLSHGPQSGPDRAATECNSFFIAPCFIQTPV